MMVGYIQDRHQPRLELLHGNYPPPVTGSPDDFLSLIMFSFDRCTPSEKSAIRQEILGLVKGTTGEIWITPKGDATIYVKGAPVYVIRGIDTSWFDDLGHTSFDLSLDEGENCITAARLTWAAVTGSHFP